MKKALLLLLFIPLLTFSQKDIVEKLSYERIKESLFITLNEKETNLVVEYAIDETAFLPLEKESNFYHKGTIGLYTSWLNPLKYKIEYENKEIDDPTEEIVNSFLNSLIGQFDIPESQLKEIPEGGSNNRAVDALPTAYFSNPSLSGWYLDVITLYNSLSVQDSVTKTKILEVCDDLIPKLMTVEDGLTYQFKSKSKVIFKHLFEVKKLSEITEKTDSYKAAQDILKDVQKNDSLLKAGLDDLEKNYKGYLKKWQIGTPPMELKLLKTYTEGILETYISEVNNKHNSLTEDILTLKNLSKLLVNSNGRTKERNKVIYIHRKSFKRKSGKINEFKISVKKIEYNEDTFKLKTTTDLVQYSLNFHPYRFLIPTVSAGVFYSYVDLSSFAAGMDENGNTIVEEVSSKDEPVYSTMLNFYLNAPLSGGILPLVQLGVDPTKERPFLLAGIGFGFPKANLALSFGSAWTWRQSLKTLSVGDTAESAAQIKEDTEFRFSSKGEFYFGIQYSF